MSTAGPFAALSARLTPLLEDNTRGEALEIRCVDEGAPEIIFVVEVKIRTDVAVERTAGAAPGGVAAENGAEATAQLMALGDAAAARPEFADALRQELAQNPWRVLERPAEEIHTGTLSDRRSVILQCETCLGAGAIACPACEGEGALRCENCAGEGVTAVVCPDCGGTLEREVEVSVLPDGDDAPVTRRTTRQACDTCGLTGRVFSTCVVCEGRGVVDCDACGGRGRTQCEACNGAGQQTEHYEARLMMAHSVDFDPPPDAPDFATALISNGYARTALRHGFQPTLVEFASVGLEHRAEFAARIPMAAAEVRIGERSFRVEALGAPLELIDPPAVLDEALTPTLERLQRHSGGEAAVAAELLRTRVGRSVLEAAAMGSENTDVAAFQPLLSQTFAQDLLAETRRRLMRADRLHRLKLWTYATIAAPLLALCACVFGYVWLVEELGDAVAGVDGWSDRSLTIAWMAPFAALWAASWWGVAARQKTRAENTFSGGAGRTMSAGVDPWVALCIGACLYAVAFIGGAPREGDRTGLAERARLWAAAEAPVLDWAFGAFKTLRWSLQGAMFAKVEEYDGPSERFYDVGPAEWLPVGDAAVVRVQDAAPAWLFARCERGRPSFGLSTLHLRREIVIDMVVDGERLRPTLAQRRGHTVFWTATAATLNALREGDVLELTITRLNDPRRRSFGVSLTSSYKTTLNALASCETRDRT